VRAWADGYTLLLAFAANAIGATLYDKFAPARRAIRRGVAGPKYKNTPAEVVGKLNREIT